MIPVRFADEGEKGLDARTIDSRRELLQRAGRALDFPDYFEPNFDSFEECLRDYPGELTIQHAETVWQKLPREAGMLVEIFETLAWEGEPVKLTFVW